MTVGDESFQYSLDQRGFCCCTSNPRISCDTLLSALLLYQYHWQLEQCFVCAVLILAHEQCLAKFPDWIVRRKMTSGSIFSLVSVNRTFSSLGKANFQVSCAAVYSTVGFFCQDVYSRKCFAKDVLGKRFYP